MKNPEEKKRNTEKKNQPDFDVIPVSELITCKYCKNVGNRETDPFCTMGHVYDGIKGTCSEWRAEAHMAPEESRALPEDPQKKTADDLPGYEIQPETIDELNHLYFTCKQLAEKYQKQEEDWAKIMQICAKLGNQRKDAEKSGGGKDAEK